MLQQCEGTLVRVCLYFAHSNRNDFQDLYQEIAYTLWKSWPTFRGESQPNTWVTRVAVNTAVRYFRKRNRMPQFIEVDQTLLENIADKASDDRYQQLYDLIDLIDNDDDRKILYLYLDKLPLSQIAQILGTSTAAVKQKLYRIRIQLKKLKDQEE